MTSWIAKRYRFEKEIERLNKKNKPQSNSILDISEIAVDNYTSAKYLAGRKPTNQYEEMALGCSIILSTGLIGTISGAATGYFNSQDYPITMTLSTAAAGAIGSLGFIIAGSYLMYGIEDKIYKSLIRRHNKLR